jgi:hypothetical protein
MIGSYENLKEIYFQGMLFLPYVFTFHLNRVGNGNEDISSEEHFENSKYSRVSYLDP